MLVLGRQLDVRERLAHFAADGCGIEDAAAGEQLQIHIAITTHIATRGDGGGEGLEFAGEVFPGAVFFRPAAAGRKTSALLVNLFGRMS